MYFKKSILFTLMLSFFLTGCAFFSRAVYRPVVNQGNYVTENEVKKLRLGQSKEQVIFVMGSPMLHSIFEGNRWYYVFREQAHHQRASQATYVLTFNKKNKLVDIKPSSI